MDFQGTSAVMQKSKSCNVSVLLKRQVIHGRSGRKKAAKAEPLEQDDTFFFIAGYTSGGAPYGDTWEEMGMESWDDLE